jgi:acetate kinase
MEHYKAFAPLHTPIAIFIMREAMRLFPGIPNFVCLDTWFHRHMPEVVTRLPIPEEYAALGVRRYGAHGLSYESIVYRLAPAVPPKLIVAHLGNGASVAAIRNGQGLNTSMGLTPLGGVISGSRTGDIDPGVLLFILRRIARSTTNAAEAADLLEAVVSKKAGLLGVSEISSDMRDLRNAISKGNAKAQLAVEMFTKSVAKWIAGYAAELGGMDMLVFTGGIGENDFATRTEVCARLATLGIILDASRNNVQCAAVISADHSPVMVRVIPPAEDLMIVNHVVRLLAKRLPH